MRKLVLYLSIIVLAGGAAMGMYTAMAQNTDIPTDNNKENSQSMQSLWLAAEALPSAQSLDYWQALYERAQGGEALPHGTDDTLLILNMIHAAIEQHNDALAEEFLPLLRDKETALFTRLYVSRTLGLNGSASLDAFQSLAQQAKAQLSGDNYHNWLSAYATALLDIADSLKSDKALWIAEAAATLDEQKIGHHRAYLLHRLALGSGSALDTLDKAAFDAALTKAEYDKAYALIASVALNKDTSVRMNALQQLYEKTRAVPKYQHIALQSLYLVPRDNPQEEAIIAHIDWLITQHRLIDAENAAKALYQPKATMRGFQRLAKAYEKQHDSTKSQLYAAKARALKNKVAQTPLDDAPSIHYEPFKTFNHDALLFDIKARKSLLLGDGADEISRLCFAAKQPLYNVTPIKALAETDAYGSDHAAENVSWNVMVLSGRSLAGDKAATATLHDTLMQWAKADAFSATAPNHNALYALKRVLLPVISAYATIKEALSQAQQQQIENWLAPLVVLSNTGFDGKVDDNNHRYMADAVQMAWSIVSENPALYHQSLQGFAKAITHMRSDGSLPLEMRRGARSVWYMRQSLASLTAIADMARLQGNDLYAYTVDGRSLTSMLTYYLNAAQNPLVGLQYRSENITPGKDYNVFHLDDGSLKKRGHGRHYMAFAESWLARNANDFTTQRLKQFMQTRVTGDAPYIDDFSGGNMSCFWWQP